MAVQKLSAKKIEYLYFLYINKHKYLKQSYFAQLFGVTKVTVSNFMADLENEGYINKNEQKSIRINEKGIEAIAQYVPQIAAIKQWLKDEYELIESEAITEAVHFLTAMSEKTTERVIKAYEWKKSMQSRYRADKIKRGEYEIYFTVLKKDELKTSMGNLGFVKPAKLVSDENGVRLVLRAHEIRYGLLRGKLKSLWYKNRRDEYIASSRSNDLYVLPSSAFRLIEDNDSIIVRIVIKALSSCSILNMPESEAVIRFHLDKEAFWLANTNQTAVN